MRATPTIVPARLHAGVPARGVTAGLLLLILGLLIL